MSKETTLQQALAQATIGQGVFHEQGPVAACVVKHTDNFHAAVEHLPTQVTIDDSFETWEQASAFLLMFGVPDKGWEGEDTFFLRHPEVREAKQVITSRKGVQTRWIA